MTITQCIQNNEWHTIAELNELSSGQTDKQHYRIVELANYGKSMIINHCLQSTERDESFYHEALIFPAAMLHGNVRRVICFGGANGGIINRLSLLPTIEEVIQIDIDETLYELSRQYLPHMHLSSHPPFRFQLIFSDPIHWINNQVKQYKQWADLIICDLPDATRDSYAANLFTIDFYRMIKQMLSVEGIFVTQAGYGHGFALDFHRSVRATLSSIFKAIESYCHFIPSYGAPWSFALASDTQYSVTVSSHLLQSRIDELPASNLVSYDFITHEHMFHLPKYIRNEISTASDLIDTNNLAFVEIAMATPRGIE